MLQKFKFWLAGILEDDPVPDEIKFIVFKINSNGEFLYLEMLGLEELNLNLVCYRPLEAEFFSLKELSYKDQKVVIYRLKTLIEDAFDADISEQLAHKKVYLYIDDFEFMFNVFHIKK